MTLRLLIALTFLCGCAQKPLMGPSLPVISNSAIEQDLSFLRDCSQIRAATPVLWLLTCQRPPHPDRTEVYEWSVTTQKIRRLTFQDGQIWDIAPVDQDHFYYSSSYDEFKEQFVSILNGSRAGSDIYLKNRLHTQFSRVTKERGLELSFFWSAAKKMLYFVHDDEKGSKIMTLDSHNETHQVYKAENKIIRNPIFMESSRVLYWVEYDQEKNPSIMSMDRAKKIKPLFSSDSKIFQIAPSAKPEQLLVGFVVGTGAEIWNWNPLDGCWRLSFRTTEPVSEFYPMNEKNLFLTIRNSLKRDTFFDFDEICHPMPPAVGVKNI